MSGNQKEWDIFISHATEDKDTFVRSLALALRSQGLKVWYDEFTLGIGDSLRKSIDEGLSSSKFGIVVISPNFIGKPWTDRELSGLYASQDLQDENLILPIWYNIDAVTVKKHLPMIADLVAIKTEAVSFQEIVEKILIKTQQTALVDLRTHMPTGISVLDALTGGGFPRPSTLSLLGVKGIGKSTLATQIQISSLFRGEPCIYITYREAPYDIIDRFIRLKAPIEEFIQKGIFKIIDNYSVINCLSKVEVDKCIGNEVLSSCLIRINNPYDTDNYFKEQLALIDKMGTGGVNIVDSVNERYDMIKTSDKGTFFRKFRARIKPLNQSAIHIVTENLGHKEYNEIMKDIQGGTIRMSFEKIKGINHRIIKIDSLRDGKSIPVERQFSITESGVEIY